jgi:Ni/Co efflux regulator RcnB
MKSKILIAAVIAATSTPMAQAQTREWRRDQQDVRSEKHDLNQAQRNGSRNDVRAEHHDVRDAQQERREDWRDYREDHHKAFQGPRFDAPFRYQSFNIGVSIGSNYYAPRYRVNNYANYHLPRPGRYQTYVRHYDDVLLVNTRNGRVIKVYRGFYW